MHEINNELQCWNAWEVSILRLLYNRAEIDASRHELAKKS